ncbi:hypothetical protein ACFVSN_15090 [Kitasatospora sp. NPDC057904]|uniref:hypothetical protein n=1 Tax=unclassified Kitasatospora TaxID=2633591 RepID=UPI0036DDB005
MTDHVTSQDPAGTPVPPPAPTAPPAPVPTAPPAPVPTAPPAPVPTAPPEPAAPAGPALSEVELVPPPPAAPETPEKREARLARRTRRRKAVVRWAAATLVCALAGTGTAMALTVPERTDIPGLATKSDGRYTFPALALPPQPPAKGPSVRKEPHRADLRNLVLPAPKEAGGPLGLVVFPSPTATPSASGSASPSATASASPSASGSPSGTASPAASAKASAATADWAPCDAVLDEQQNPDDLRALLLQNACRAAAVREWTASDGTRTQIRLLRFGSSFEGGEVFSALRANSLPKALPGAKAGSHDGWDALPNVDLAVKESSVQGAKGDPTARVAYLGASNVLAVITMTNPKGVPVAPFRQVATLQSDLLN